MKRHFVICVLGLFLLHGNTMAQGCGCTDPMALNYSVSAVCNNGSCVYDTIPVSPASSVLLAAALTETSGLIKWDNLIWTHNDNTDTHLYALDPQDGHIVHSYLLSGVTNTDWEEISQDENYIYIGDFGNNGQGNRTDLKIFRINKSSLQDNTPVTDVLYFSYSNQINFSPSAANQTDFDCEAMIVSADSIYLFTKQWLSNKTSVYSLPKTPGTYVAHLKTTFDVQGLITGATSLEYKKLIALCGYSSILQPFVYLLYDYSGRDFFSGNKRKIPIELPFHQVEGITTSNGFTYYISNEYFSRLFITTPQKLHTLDLSTFLGRYVTSASETENTDIPFIYPNPSTDVITLKTASEMAPSDYLLLNLSGTVVKSGIISKENPYISLSNIAAGLYLLKLGEGNRNTFRVIKQ